MLTKRLICALIFFILVIPKISWASFIVIHDNNIHIHYWNEKRYIYGDDLIVESELDISVSRQILNYSNNVTLTLYNGEPNYRPSEDARKEENFVITVTEKNNRVLGENESLVERINTSMWVTGKKITIIPPKEINHWIDYKLKISYKLNNYIQEIGDVKYFSIKKGCSVIGESKNNCPNPNAVETSIYIPKKNIKIESCTICNKEYRNNKYLLLHIESTHDESKIEFKDMDEIEKKESTKWYLNNIFLPFAFLIFSIVLLEVRGYFARKKDRRKLKKLDNILSGKDKIDGVGKETLKKLKKKFD